MEGVAVPEEPDLVELPGLTGPFWVECECE
jgi:hypothetical protein